MQQRANSAVFCSTGSDNHIGPPLPVRCRGTSPRKRGMDSVLKEIGALTKPEKYVVVVVFYTGQVLFWWKPGSEVE